MQPLTTDLPDTHSMTDMGTMSTNNTMATPLRTFLRTESGGAGVLVAAIAVALLWGTWVNSGLIAGTPTFFINE